MGCATAQRCAKLQEDPGAMGQSCWALVESQTGLNCAWGRPAAAAGTGPSRSRSHLLSSSHQDDGWRATVSLTDSDLLVLEGDSYTIRLLRDFRVSLSKMVETCLCYEMAAIPGDLHHQHSQLLDILVDLLKGPPGSFGA